jgi:ectoine hydroxylase-related dioxygenase (phytanoyl-CoA dioxygenase family)
LSSSPAQARYVPRNLNARLLTQLFLGDILFFTSHLAHRSGLNNTSKPRAMVYATYHAVTDGSDLREKYYAHRRATFPPDHGE